MKKSIFSALCLVLLVTTTQSAWGAEVELASWEFSSGTAGTNYPSNKTNFTATSGSCSNSTFYLNGTGSTWNSTKGWAFTAVTDIQITIKAASNIAQGSVLTFKVTTFYNKASNAPMKGFDLTCQEGTGNFGTTGLSTTSWSLSTTSTEYSVTYTTQNNIAKDDAIVLKLTQTGTAGAGQGFMGPIFVTMESGSTEPTPLVEPTNLSVSNVTSTTVNLSWDAVTNATGYIVTYIDANDVMQTKEVNGTTTTLEGLSANTYYVWTVKAVGDGTNYSDSPESDASDFTTTELATYTITWMSNNSQHAQTQVTQGEAITLPTEPAAPSSCSDKVFMGWTAAPSVNADGTGITYITAETTPTGDVTYHAVFAKATTTGGGAGSNQTYNFADMDNFNATEDTEAWGTSYSKRTTTFSDGAYVELASANKQTSTIKDCPVSKGGDVIFKAPTGSTISALTFICKQWGTKTQTITLHTSTNGENYTKTTVTSENFTLTASGLSNVVAVKFTFNSSDNQVGYQSLAVTYGGGGGTTYSEYVTQCVECTPNTLSLTTNETTVNLPEAGGVDVNIASFVTIGNNTTDKVTYSGTGVNSSTGAFHTTTKGDYVITISQQLGTGNPVICGVSKTFTVHVLAKPTLELIASTPLAEFAATCMEPSAVQQITVHGFNLEDKITASLGSGSAFQLSATGSNNDAEWSTSVDFAKDGNNRVNSTLYIRLKSNIDGCPSEATSTRSSTIKASSNNAAPVQQAVSGKISSPGVTVKLNDQGNNYNITGKRLCCTIAEDEVKGANTNGFSTTPCEGALFSHFTLDPNNLETKVKFPYSITSTDALTFYAVYKKSEDGGAVSGDYELVTATQDDWSGEYLIAFNSSNFMNGSNATTACEQSTSVSPGSNLSNNTVAATWGDTYAVEFKAVTGGYVLRMQDGTYLYSSGNSNNNQSGTLTDASAKPLTITFNKSTDIDIVYNKSALHWNDNTIASGGQRFRFYEDGKQSKIYLYKKTGSFTYDLTPCGPVIKGTNNIKVTSVNGAWVRSITDIAITGERLPSNVTITAKVLSGNFKLRKPATSSTGSTEIQLATGHTEATYNGTLALLYTPKAAGETSNGEIELRVYTTGGNTEHAKCTLTVQGHALPEKFVIAANTGSGWVALPNDKGATLETAGTNTAYPITVDNNGDPTKATLAPSSTVYAGTGRASTYAYSSQSGVRFTYGGKYLEGSLAADTKLCLSPNNSEHAQSWYLESDNFKDYNAYLGARTNANRHLAYDATQKAIANYTAVGTVRFLPIDKECRYFPAPKVTVSTTKSTEVTLTFDALAGATGYKISTDGNTWNDASYTIADGVVTLTISGLDPNTDYTYYVRGIDSGSTLDDCAESAQVDFHTTNCDDVPQNISYTSDVNSIKLSWTMTSATATVQVFSDDTGTTQVGNHTDATSPYTITGLAKATTYYVKILAGGSCPSKLVEVSTERPQLDVVEWYEDKIDVEINTDEKISVLLENQVTKGTGSGNVAEDLFFSKYYEAKGDLKMLGIFNGTDHDIDLTNIRIWGAKEDVTVWTKEGSTNPHNYVNLGNIKQTILSGEEMILFTVGNYFDGQIGKYTKSSEYPNGYTATSHPDNWYLVGVWGSGGSDTNGNYGLSFSGAYSLALVDVTDAKNPKFIDVIGAGTVSAPAHGGVKNSPTCTMDKNTSAFSATKGEDFEGNEAVISTNSFLLVRKNTVESGAKAVEHNTEYFKTLGNDYLESEGIEGEWVGKSVCAETSSQTPSAVLDSISCSYFDYVSTFDYNGYYTTYDSLMVKEFDGNGRNPDGTITIEIPRLDTLSCRGLKIIASDESGHVLTAKEYRVPIIVYQSTTTADATVFHFSEDTCKTCDVVVRPNIKLQAKAKSDGGKVQFRNMMVYAKGNFEIPTGVDFMLDNLEMHAKNDTVAYALIDGSLTVSNKITHVKRINSVTMGGAGYHFSLPYPCDGTSIRQYNGNSLGKYDVDWVVFYYAGDERAETGTWNEAGTGYNGKSYWRTFPNANFELQPNVAYIIATAGINAGPSLKSVYFPPKASKGYSETTYTESTPDSKTVAVKAYTGTAADKHANDRGWNFIGHPYISIFNHQTTGATGTNNDKVKMGYWEGTEYSETDKVYVNVPQNGVTSYHQDEAANLQMSPFLGYFVQVAGDADAELTFIKGARKLMSAAPMMRAASVRDEYAEVALKLTAPSGAFDRTTILVDEAYTIDYEINRDLGKMARAAGLPRFYSISLEGLNEKMCYQALPSPVAENNVPLGFYAYEAGTYTIAIDSTRGDLSAVTAVALKVDGNVVHDLLAGPYTFSVARARTTNNASYSVSIQRKAQVTTDVNVVGNSEAVAPVVYTQGHRMHIQQLPIAGRLHIIDAVGRTLVDEQLDGCSERQYTLATDGVYVVRVATDSNVFIVKVAIR